MFDGQNTVVLSPAYLGIYKSSAFPTALELADSQAPEQRKKYSSLPACGTNKFEFFSIRCNQEVWEEKVHIELTHSLWGAEKPSEIIVRAAEFQILCLIPASNSDCHNLLLLHRATLLVPPWRTDTEEQKGWRICENPFPSTIPKIRNQEEKECIRLHAWSRSKQQDNEVIWWVCPILTTTLAATCTVLGFQKLKTAFLAIPIKQCFCSKCLRIYEEYHSLNLVKRLSKTYTVF